MKRCSVLCAVMFAFFVLCLPGPVLAVVQPERSQEEQELITPLPMILESVMHANTRAGILPDDTGWESFLFENPGVWYRRLELRTGRPAMIWGQGLPWITGRGNTLKRAAEPTLQDLENLARDFINVNSGLFRVEQDNLRLSNGRSGVLKDGSVWFVDFDWVPNGIPALYARVFFRVNNGNLIQMGSRGIIEPGWLPVKPQVSSEAALQESMAKVRKVYPGAGTVRDPGTLMYVPVADDPRDYTGAPGQGMSYKLGWRVIFKQEGSLATWTGYVDAITGDLIALFDGNSYQCDPAALTQGKVFGGVFSISPEDPEIVRAFPYTLVTIDAVQAVSDFNGIFPWTTGVTESGLNGRYADLNCVGCSNPTQAHAENTILGDLDFGLGGLDAQGNGVSTRPERNGFYHTSLMQSMAAKWLNIPFIDSTMPVNVNIAMNCNAFYDGVSINFFTSGGGCNNTAEASGVVYHEWGHALDSNTGFGGDSARGEAIGDLNALHINHSSNVGQGFVVGGGPVRNIDETTSGYGLLDTTTVSQCPGGGGPLGYQVHCEGQIMGQAWYRLAVLGTPGPPAVQSLTQKYGPIGGWYTSERLYFGSMQGSDTYLPGAAGSLYDAVMAVDDDDGNLANGTPNAEEINDAFDSHGMAPAVMVQPSTTPCTPPAAPSIGALPQIDPTNGIYQIQLSWTDVGASFYDVYRNEKSIDGAYIPVALNLTQTTFLDQNLTNGLTYYYVVLAVDGAGCVSRDDNAIGVILDLAELTMDSYQVDDSAGNGNGAVDPGETVTLPLWLLNAGAGDTTNVTATLSTAETFVTVLQDTASFGNIPGSGTASTNPPHYSIQVDADNAHCEKQIPLVLEIESDQGCWVSVFALPVGSGLTDIVFNDVTVRDLTPQSNGNGVFEPGEQVDLVINLMNIGGLSARNVTAELVSSHPDVTIDNGTAMFGTIPQGGDVDSQSPYFTVSLANIGTLCGEVLDFELTILSDDGCWKESFSIQTGKGGSTAAIFFDDLESGAPGWTHGASMGTDSWELGFPGLGRGREPDRPFSGDNCWGTDLGNGTDGDYDADTVQWLESPPVDCAAYQSVYLKFYRYLAAEEATYDQAVVSVNGTPVWGNASGIDHRDFAWVEQEFDVSSIAAGQSDVRIRFELASDMGFELGGWNVDDVELFGLVCEPPVPRPDLLFDSSYADDGITDGTGNANSVIDPGEGPAIVVDLINIRNATATSVTGTLSLESPVPGVSVVDNQAQFPDIAPQGGEASLSPHFQLAIDETIAACGDLIPLILDVSYSDGTNNWNTQARFAHRIGTLGAGSGPPERIFFDDLESGRGEWRHGMIIMSQDDWMLGPPGGVSATDPPSASSGSNIWGNDLGGNFGGRPWNGDYQRNVHNRLDSPAIDCTMHEQVQLQYQRWLSVEDGQYDHARIWADGTSAWENPVGNDTLDTSWQLHQIDISAVADRNPSLTIRFELDSDGGLQYGGWNIDDFEIIGEPRERICIPFDCTAPFPDAVGNELMMWRDNNDVVGDLTQYTGSGLSFNIYRTDQKIALGSLGPAELRLPRVGAASITDSNAVLDPALYFYRARALNDCGQEEQ